MREIEKNGFIQETKGSKYLDQGKAHAVAHMSLKQWSVLAEHCNQLGHSQTSYNRVPGTGFDVPPGDFSMRWGWRSILSKNTVKGFSRIFFRFLYCMRFHLKSRVASTSISYLPECGVGLGLSWFPVWVSIPPQLQRWMQTNLSQSR